MLVYAECGESFYSACQRVSKMASLHGRQFTLRHNEVDVRVYPGSHEYDLEEKYLLQREIQRMGKN